MISSFNRFSLLSISLLLSTSHGCSISCDTPDRACVDGWLGSDCSGFIGCVSLTQPCGGECPAEYPVVSEDGLSCSVCEDSQGDGQEDSQGDGQEDSQGNGPDKVCPQCEDGEVWCRTEQSCQARTDACGGRCPSLVYPVLNVSQQECYSCPEYSRWCKEEERCFDPKEEPCNGECTIWGLHYCPETDTCLEDAAPCGPQRQEVDLTTACGPSCQEGGENADKEIQRVPDISGYLGYPAYFSGYPGYPRYHYYAGLGFSSYPNSGYAAYPQPRALYAAYPRTGYSYTGYPYTGYPYTGYPWPGFAALPVGVQSVPAEVVGKDHK